MTLWANNKTSKYFKSLKSQFLSFLLRSNVCYEHSTLEIYIPTVLERSEFR